MSNWLFISNIVSLIFSVLAFIAAIGCIAYTIGLRNSTHQISYVPLGNKAKDGGNVAEEKPEEEEDYLQELDNF
jgi:hypothetical protein